MVRSTRPVARPSADPPPQGVYLTTPQLLELVSNAQAAGIPSATANPPFARLCSDYTHLGGTILRAPRPLWKSNSG